MSAPVTEDEIPFHLMPLAALLGTFALFSTLSVLFKIYRKYTSKDPIISSTSLKTRDTFLQILFIVIAFISYATIVARVQNIQHLLQPFDPYGILSLPVGTTDTTLIKASYRKLSLKNHPDKEGGSDEAFHKVQSAYRALTDPESRQNYEMHGHPDGAQSTTLAFAIPDWLLNPQGSVAVVLLLSYLSFFAFVCYYAFNYVKNTTEIKKKDEGNQSVANEDCAYLLEKMNQDSTHIDIFFLIVTTPENIQHSFEELEGIESARIERLDFKRKNDAMLDLSGDWADDEMDDEADEETKAQALKAAEFEEEKRRTKAQLAGKLVDGSEKLEGIDEGVIGQKWVECVLNGIGAWPPKDIGAMNKMIKDGVTWSVGGGNALGGDPLQIPAIKMNVLKLIGRLNSAHLNNHPELMDAVPKSLLDHTYFKSSIEFRKRTGPLLEAALGIAATARCYPLVKTVIEAITMFRVGCPAPHDKATVKRMHNLFQRQFGTYPRLVIAENRSLETEGEDEIATGDACFLKMEVERMHAEGFTRSKIAQAQKQGIPPEAALSNYQEGWWILIRAEKIAELDGSSYERKERFVAHPGKGRAVDTIDSNRMLQYHSKGLESDVLLSCWPSIVTNVAQKKGHLKIPFKAPAAPGRYKFYIDIKSQEFLECDVHFELEARIEDLKEVKKKQEEEEEEEDDDNKKDK